MPKIMSVREFQEGKFPCYTMPGREDVTLDVCASLTSDPDTNGRFCSTLHCGSPARICASCVRDKFFGKKARSVSPTTGLCAWHIARGRYAVRSGTQEKEAANPRHPVGRPARMRDAAVRATPAEPPPFERTNSQSRTEKMIRCSYYILLPGGRVRELCRDFLVSPEKYAQLEKDGLIAIASDSIIRGR